MSVATFLDLSAVAAILDTKSLDSFIHQERMMLGSESATEIMVA
jgi:hypothetical protein